MKKMLLAMATVFALQVAHQRIPTPSISSSCLLPCLKTTKTERAVKTNYSVIYLSTLRTAIATLDKSLRRTSNDL